MNKETYSIKTITEIIYPSDGPVFCKYDNFYIVKSDFPKELLAPDADKNKIYDFLNENGYWLNGWQEATDEDDAWIENHPEYQGMQNELTIEVDIYS